MYLNPERHELGKIDSRMSYYKIYHLSLRFSGIPSCPLLQERDHWTPLCPTPPPEPAIANLFPLVVCRVFSV